MPAQTAGGSPAVSELEHKVAELSDRLRAQREEYNEALQREVALAEILRVINEPGTDLARVFSVMIEKATKLCAASYGYVWRYDGKHVRAVAASAQQTFGDWLRDSEPRVPAEQSPLGQALLSHRLVHVIDAKADEAYKTHLPFRELVDRGGVRTLLHVPLLKGNELLGVITVYRQEPRAFSDRQIALIESFAVQAVIALENARLLTEQREALEQQTATAEVLQVINSSPGELAPVFEAMLAKAHALCGVAYGSLQLYNGEKFYAVAVHGLAEAVADRLRQGYAPGPNLPVRRLLDGEDCVHVRDLAEIDDPIAQSVVEAGGMRTVLFVALRKDHRLLGMIVAARREVQPFADKQITLLENFAAQAVIAMENARLLGELRRRNDELAEALEFRTATGEVLRIVASSPDDLQSVFDAMLSNATELCEAKFSCLFLYDGEAFRVVADRDLPPDYAAAVRGRSFEPGTNAVLRSMLEEKTTVNVTDVFADLAYASGDPLRVANVVLGGVRSFVCVPLLRKDELIGIFAIYRTEPGGFAENQVALVSAFADQAAIAIENARLLGELRERSADLARSVDELTATSDVLKIISRSSVDLTTVLNTLVETAARLCRADDAKMFRRRDDLYHMVASHGHSDEAKQFYATHPIEPSHGTVTGRVALERRPIHIVDVLEDPDYTFLDAQAIAGFRTALGIPLLREESLIGVFVINRTRVEPFTDQDIELVTTFADQAVIAIENARLFEELRDRQAELRVTFDNMGGGVAMFDADLRLTAWNRNFQQIMDLSDQDLAARPRYSEYLRLLADRGEFGTENVESVVSGFLEDTDTELRYERTRPDGRSIEVRRNAVPGGGFVLIYIDITESKRSEEKIRAARDMAETALKELKTAQASLIHAEKMASLGQLTAGIAHEIKNPLNFVNNFAGLSVELLQDLTTAVKEATADRSDKRRGEIDETIELLTTNLGKIASHGRRADGIVKSMLAHSRGGSGDRRSVELNAVVEEALNLAYHGARAQDQSFNVTLERDLHANIAPIEIVPQDVTRVLLNLIGNGFYAVEKRRRQEGEAFRPTVKVTTDDLPDAVEIAIRDNGIGIPAQYREKLFQPSFTTKPTGEGTGLGLSISYDIVTQQHGGTITVDSAPGQFTEFRIRLPRRRQAAPAAERPA
jgi:GAF domain-containing protein